jgi:hypothetical protein
MAHVQERTFSSRGSLALRIMVCRQRLKCDGTRAEPRFRLSAKRTSPFKSAWASVQSTTGRRGVRICGSNAGYTMFRGSVKGTGYPLHSPFTSPLVRHRVTSHFSWTLPVSASPIEALLPVSDALSSYPCSTSSYRRTFHQNNGEVQPFSCSEIWNFYSNRKQ